MSARHSHRRNKRNAPCRLRWLFASIVIVISVSLSTGRAVGQSDLQPSSAAAQSGDDYNPQNNKWNGLTTLVALAHGLGISMDLRSDLDWGDVSEDDVLMILYPTSQIVPRHLSSFIRGGGRVVLGDDFGQSDRLFAELGLLRADAIGVGASRYHNDLAFAPIAKAIADRSLADRAPTLVTNHPAIFTELGFSQPIYRFGPGETVVSEGELGSGLLIGLADPSILINRMLQFDDNFQFAINLLRKLMDKGSRQIIVITGRFRLTGEPVVKPERPTGLAGAVVLINGWLGEINAYIATKQTARSLALLIAGLVGVLFLLIMPLRTKTQLSGSWTRARPKMVSPLTAHDIVHSYDQPLGKQSFTVAAAAIRDGVSRRLADRVGLSDPFHAVPKHVLFHRLESTAGPTAVTCLNGIYQALKNLPSRDHATSQVDSRHVSKQEFESLSSAVAKLYRSLE